MLLASRLKPVHLSFPMIGQALPQATIRTILPTPASGLPLFLSCPGDELGAGGKESLPSAIAAPTMTTDEAQ